LAAHFVFSQSGPCVLRMNAARLLSAAFIRGTGHAQFCAPIPRTGSTSAATANDLITRCLFAD
jgi:hypothetical protein